jgi:hypothetical protein
VVFQATNLLNPAAKMADGFQYESILQQIHQDQELEEGSLTREESVRTAD